MGTWAVCTLFSMRRALVPLALLAVLGTAPPARAFCGFYVGGAGSKLFNNATQVALLRDGTRTVLSMANNYQGPPENFAMVVPVAKPAPHPPGRPSKSRNHSSTISSQRAATGDITCNEAFWSHAPDSQLAASAAAGLQVGRDLPVGG